MPYYVDRSSVIDPEVEIGNHTRIWHFVHVSHGTRIGENCVLGQGVYIGNNVTIGNGVKLENLVAVFEGVTIEDDVFCGPSCVFTNVINPRAAISRKDEYRPTLVKKGATIGANATIVCGVTIGRYAMVGAGAVVTRDVPDHGLVYGGHADHRGYVCQCGASFRGTWHPFVGARRICEVCGSRYIVREDMGLEQE